MSHIGMSTKRYTTSATVLCALVACEPITPTECLEIQAVYARPIHPEPGDRRVVLIDQDACEGGERALLVFRDPTDTALSTRVVIEASSRPGKPACLVVGGPVSDNSNANPIFAIDAPLGPPGDLTSWEALLYDVADEGEPPLPDVLCPYQHIGAGPGLPSADGGLCPGPRRVPTGVDPTLDAPALVLYHEEGVFFSPWVLQLLDFWDIFEDCGMTG